MDYHLDICTIREKRQDNSRRYLSIRCTSCVCVSVLSERSARGDADFPIADSSDQDARESNPLHSPWLCSEKTTLFCCTSHFTRPVARLSNFQLHGQNLRHEWPSRPRRTRSLVEKRGSCSSRAVAAAANSSKYRNSRGQNLHRATAPFASSASRTRTASTMASARCRMATCSCTQATLRNTAGCTR